MSIKSYKPYTPSRRAMTTLSFEEITKATPEKSLLVTLKKSGGRNQQGVITTRHIGGGNKRKYRIIDFKRNKDGVVGKVADGKPWLECETAVNLIVVKKGERYNETGKIRI